MCSGDRPHSTLADLLGDLKLSGDQDRSRQAKADKGEPLRIADFISLAVVVEEELALGGGGLTIKMNARPKLEKVSLSAWIVANARIMSVLLARDPDFDVERLSPKLKEPGRQKLGRSKPCKQTQHAKQFSDLLYRLRKRNL